LNIHLSTAEPIARLIEEFSQAAASSKGAQRLTYHPVQASCEKAAALAKAIVGLKENLSLCPVCAISPILLPVLLPRLSTRP